MGLASCGSIGSLIVNSLWLIAVDPHRGGSISLLPDSAFFQNRKTPIAQLKTPIALIVQVLSALTEGVGINAATRLYGVSKNSIYLWQERLSGLKKPCSCRPIYRGL